MLNTISVTMNMIFMTAKPSETWISDASKLVYTITHKKYVLEKSIKVIKTYIKNAKQSLLNVLEKSRKVFRM